MMSVRSHTHDNGTCPITGASGSNPHSFCPPQSGDTRAPCPALNSLANHGYLPRDGKQISANMIIAAVQEAFQLSTPLAFFLTRGALALLSQRGKFFCLSDLARHNKIEHNASLFHEDAGPRDEYAPIKMSMEMLEKMFQDSKDGVLMTPEDIARTRVRREATYPKGIDPIHAELARGEVAIVLNLFNNPDPSLEIRRDAPARSAISSLFRRLLMRKDTQPEYLPLPGPPISLLRTWMSEERLPDGWQPYHTVSLWQTIVTTTRLKWNMRKLVKASKKTNLSVVPQKPKERELDIQTVLTVPEESEGAEQHDSLRTPGLLTRDVSTRSGESHIEMPPTPTDSMFTGHGAQTTTPPSMHDEKTA